LLDRYHTEPGKTVPLLESFRDKQARSSYQVLTAAISHLPLDTRVVDVACGDGHLLALLAARGMNRLVGIDRSPQEVAAARARLGPGVALHCCDASALPLPDRSVDVVVCHMALMLMEPVDLVLAEIARVLQPGHFLLAIINRAHPDPAFEVFSRELRQVNAAAGLDRLQLGPPDIYSRAGLRARLRRPCFDADSLSIHDFVVQVRASPQGLWPLFECRYDVFRLPASAQAALQQSLLSAWDGLCDPSGQVTAAMGLRLIKCPTRAAVGSS
jgi:SAM-dependent methyltransferase